jgi:soluble lytic murein transglycosylase
MKGRTQNHIRTPSRVLLILTLLVGSAGALAILVPARQAMASEDALGRFEQRRHYRSALNHLHAGRMTSFRRERALLLDYPLLPYLDYAAMARRLSRVTPREVAEFRATWQEQSPVADRLHDAWLRNLARRGEWQTYREHYEPSADPELACLNLLALYHTGDTEHALEQVKDLWLVGYSQPKACDPLFETWVDAGYLDDDLVWQRVGLALEGRKTTLARYLVRFLEPRTQGLAHTFLRVHRSPEVLRRTRDYRADTPRIRQIVAHGLRRLASRDAALAGRLWEYYRPRLAFTAQTASEIEERILVQSARQDALDPDEALELLEGDESPTRAVTEAFARHAIRHQDWPAAQRWLNALPKSLQGRPRWQYWQARAEQGMNHRSGASMLDLNGWPPEAGVEVDLVPPTPPIPESEQALRDLATDRSYYGYMAADYLNLPPRLEHEEPALDPTLVRSVEQEPGLQRALELFVMGDLSNARREWRFATRGMTREEVLAAGQAANLWGWHRRAIQSSIDAAEWDRLNLRFPVAYPELMLVQAKVADLDPGWLYGIARQESAFMPDARSSAGALGLLQVMPRTARITARKYGIPYKQSRELLDPAKNVRIGGTYLGEMLERFDRNRVLATAAYNAGPNRVERWRDALAPSPADIWIESIPLRETRGYVQNVLVFAYIYGERLGLDPMFLLDHER